MPFAKNSIEPTRLSRARLGKEYKFDLDCISNNTLGGLLRQLSSLAVRADSIFSDIAEECVSVVKKTQRIRNRIGEITKHVDKLNAKAVTVPVGDLTSFAHHSNHFQAEHGFDCYLFSPASRPDAVVDLYDKSAPSPLSTIRRCNLLRSDGKTGSKYFSPALVINEEKFDNVDTHLSFRKPPTVQFRKSVQVLQIERETKELKSPRVRERPHSMSVLTELELTTNSGCSTTMPTPEQRLRDISRSQPVTLVPIDVSGSSFNRMCDYRSSIRSISTQYEVLEEGTRAGTGSSSSARRKRQRRQTLSGIPGFVFAEISTPDTCKVSTLRTRSVSRERWERPRSMALEASGSGRRGRSRERRRADRIGSGDEGRDHSPISKSCNLRRSFRSLFRGSRSHSRDLWAEGRPRSPGPPMIDLNVPLRRSRSLPRSLKTVMRETSASQLETGGRSASTEGRLDGWTEEELIERDLPWVRGKPPTAPARAVRPPRIQRSRSQTVARRRSGYVVDSSDDSSTAAGPASASTSGAARPYGLRGSLSQGQLLRLPIPVSMPTTPSTESLTSSAADSAHRMNIPAGGAAWEPFASVRLRQHNKGQTPDDRQSSSGNWSASSSSARQSLESDYNRLMNSPEKRSQTSLDKDSALSLNIHSSSEDRYTTDNNGDMGEETSTVTGDTSTINGETATEDTSTINGDVDSVIDVKSNFTKMNTEDWLNSLNRDKRSRRKSKHDSLDSGSGLTQQNLRAHDHAHKPFVRSLSRLPDEESSVYSVDQEGFYTSMHRDSGLKRSQSEMIQEETQWQLSMDSFMSSSNSTLASTMPTSKPSRADKVRRRSTSFLSNLPGLKKIKSAAKKNRKTPPPPPRRVSTVLDKSNLTLHLEDPDLESPPTPCSEMSKSADTSTETVINTGIRSPPPKTGHNDSSCESDAEAIYARVKTKTSISAAGIPSLCSVTPLCSDEEDADMLSFSRSWRGHVISGGGNDTSTWTGSLVSTKSAPGSLLDGSMITSTPLHSTVARSRLDASGNKSGVDLSISDTLMQVADSSGDSSGFSTWPRSPASKGDRQNEQKAPRPPRTLDFSSSGVDPRDARNIIPEAKTPDDDQKTRALTTRNSFRGSREGSVGGSERDACSSKGASSIYSPSNSSIPSSLSDDMPAMPIMSVRPAMRAINGERNFSRLGNKNKKHGDVASLSGSGGSACTSPTNKSGHVYANVVVQNNGPLSASSSASSLSFGGSSAVLPTSSVSSVSDPNSEYMSVTSTWPRSSKTNIETASESGKSDKKRLSTFAKPEKEEPKEERQEEPLSVPVTSYNGPVPAHAKLIISSPVATKVSFKENPYKRSVCSPVTTHELMSFWNQSVKDKPYNSSPVSSALDGSDLSSREPSPSAFKPVFPAPSQATSQIVSRPLFPSLSSMKHSITFPTTGMKKEEKSEPPAAVVAAAAAPSTYGRSWYDGILTQKSSKSSEIVPITTASTVSSKPLSSLSSQVSLTSFISDSPTPSLLDQRRDSISSNVSSDSGSRKHVTFATVNKASPASSQFSLKMDDGTASLTGSITGSISSNDSRDRNPTFSSFAMPETPTNSLQRGSTTSNLKGILSSQPPVSSELSTSPLRTAGQSFHRPTSLALSKTVENPSRLQSIGEGPATEESTDSLKKRISIGANMRKPSPIRTIESSPKKVISQPKDSADKTKSVPATPSGNRTLPTVCDWPAPTTNTGPSRSDPKSTAVSKQEAVKTTTVSNGPRQLQTARVSPTVKTEVPKLSSFRPLSSTLKAPQADQSTNQDTKSPAKPSDTTKIESGKQSVPAKSTESPPKSVTPTSRLLSAASIDKKDEKSTDAQKCGAASPCRTVDGKQPSVDVSVNKGKTASPSVTKTDKASDVQSKPPTGPTAAKVSPRIGATRPTALVTSSNKSPSPPKYTSVLNNSSNSLTPSTGTNGSSGTLTNSTSTLSLSSISSSHGSKLSLNKSTDSLASNSSAQSVIERNRAARMAFLHSGPCQPASNSPPVPDPATDPFNKYKSKETVPSTCTGTPPPPNSVDDRFAKYKIGQRKSSTGSLTSAGSGSPTSPTCTGPSQGRFVNSMINQLATKSGGDSPPSPTTPSSGLGSSIASPQSPLKTLTPHGTPCKEMQTIKATGIVPPSINNNNNKISEPQTTGHPSLSVGKKESCC